LSYFGAGAGAAAVVGVENSFIAPSRVLYTPHPRGTHTNNQARAIVAGDDFVPVVSAMCLLLAIEIGTV
jgi:hypothetical protein